MTTALLISLRETLEASLIVGIVLSFLKREGETRAMRYAWLGTVLGVIVSIAVAYGLHSTLSTLSDVQEEIFEGILMLTAAGMLFWILLWLQKHATNVRRAVIARVEDHLSKGTMTGIFLLCFTAVLREGVEMAVFVLATIAAADGPNAALLGTLGGIVLGIALTIGVLFGMRGLPLRHFFRLSSLLLLCIGFGLAVRGIGELQEAHILPLWSKALWDTSMWLDEKSFFGHIARTMVGYESRPTGGQIVVGCIYLLLAMSINRLRCIRLRSSSV